MVTQLNQMANQTMKWLAALKKNFFNSDTGANKVVVQYGSKGLFPDEQLGGSTHAIYLRQSSSSHEGSFEAKTAEHFKFHNSVSEYVAELWRLADCWQFEGYLDQVGSAKK